jgi:CheY-like chemotaxis protein
VVEDDAAARRAIARILRKLDFAVLETGTVADALQCLSQSRRPDWILLDLMLPDGCGSRVLSKAKADGLDSTVCWNR